MGEDAQARGMTSLLFETRCQPSTNSVPMVNDSKHHRSGALPNHGFVRTESIHRSLYDGSAVSFQSCVRSIVYSRHLVPPPLKCGGVHQSLKLHKGIIRCHTFCDFVSSSSFCDFAPSATSHLLRFIKPCSAGRLGSKTGIPRYVPCILLWAK